MVDNPSDRSKPSDKREPKIDTTDMPKKDAAELIENVDYYYENGLFVFTEKYHLDKGYCCNNNCRHCPYKNKC